MFKIINNFFKDNNKEYQSCKFIQGGIMFLGDSIISCCSNKKGITFVENYCGGRINWDKIQKIRKEIIKNCKNNIIPDTCEGCVELEKKCWDKKNLIDNIYINHWIYCNCGCIYCNAISLKHLQKNSSYKGFYSVYNHMKTLYQKKMISPNLHLEFIGGEIAILDETDKIINLCIENGVGDMSFHSSCIKYSKGIEYALKNIKSSLEFSIDSGNKELYKKIKRIDAFDDVISNIKKYMASCKNPTESIIAKYIIIDNYNDNIDALEEWITLINNLGIKRSKIEINFKKYFKKFNSGEINIPLHYYELNNYYKKRTSELSITNEYWEFSKRILNRYDCSKDFL